MLTVYKMYNTMLFNLTTKYRSYAVAVSLITEIDINMLECFVDNISMHFTTLRKDFIIVQLYWWLFSSTKHCS